MAKEFEDFVNDELPKRISTKADPTKVVKGMLPVTTGSGLGVELKPIEEVALQGKQGDNNYQLAVKNGFVGTETQYLESIKGKDGESIKGSPGTDGKQGPRGIPVVVLGGKPSSVEVLAIVGPKDQDAWVTDDKKELWLYAGGVWINCGDFKSVPSYEVDTIKTEVATINKNIFIGDERNGYLWGVLDLLNRLALALDKNGNLINKGVNVLEEINKLKLDVQKALGGNGTVDWSERSGYLWGILDKVNRLALALDKNGNLINKGRNILAELDKIGDSKWLSPSKKIVSWGDSMSENVWQPFLRQMMPDRIISAQGVGGQRSGQIGRRQGGISALVTVANNKIPASGSVVVTVDDPFVNTGAMFYGYLYGVYGALTQTGGVHSFIRGKPGDEVIVDPETPFILSSTDYDYDFQTTIIWAGNNDYTTLLRPGIDDNVKRMVDFLKPQEKRFIVIGMAIADYSDRYIGTPYYTEITALHKLWKQRWPNNFIDITPIMQRHYDPNNPTDVENLANGCTPSSLRKDQIHFNDAGAAIVAKTIFDFLNQRGW